MTQVQATPVGLESRPAPARRRKGRGSGPSNLMLAPALAFFGVFALLPLAGVVVLSLFTWDGLGTPHFAGLQHWRETFADPVMHHAIWLSLLMTIGCFVCQAPVSLLLGVFMAGRQRYRALFSVLYFLPLLFSATAVGIAFTSMLDPNFGLSQALNIDILQQDWLGDPTLAFWVVIVVISWSFVPFHSLLYQAGVRQIPRTLYEAASLDGAGRVRCFLHVTVPQLKYTIVTSTTLMLVGSLTYFDLVFIMTQGGPGDATRILPLDMYLRGFDSHQMGAASVVAVLLVVVGLLLAMALNRMSGAYRMDSQQEGA